MSEIGPQNPAPGRIFGVDSEFQVKSAGCWQPEAKTYLNLPWKFRKLFFMFFFCRRKASTAELRASLAGIALFFQEPEPHSEQPNMRPVQAFESPLYSN